MPGQCSVLSTVVTFYKLCQEVEHMNHRLYACRTFVLITMMSFLLEMLWVQSQLTQGQYY